MADSVEDDESVASQPEPRAPAGRSPIDMPHKSLPPENLRLDNIDEPGRRIAEQLPPQELLKLARMFVIVLFASFFVHYGALFLLTIIGLLVTAVCPDQRNQIVESTKELKDAFNTWLPVMSGFVGSLVTYYFTSRERRSR